jgi:hypothetical protein
MPYILTECWYPAHLDQKVAQRYLETLQKMPIPSIIKRLVPAASTTSKKGIEVVNIDDVKNKDLGEGLEYAHDFMAKFHDIEGFKYQVRVLSTVSEALKRIGVG